MYPRVYEGVRASGKLGKRRCGGSFLLREGMSERGVPAEIGGINAKQNILLFYYYILFQYFIFSGEVAEIKP